ncbi:deoxynucleoside kinase [Saccharicrinis aurantiacus]|uniref:deoxynucleoside kinase n=1 Tax=Saccharicrinis aurantiacus TaxID=1849719 RepID=UPI00094FB672|nr:deoxynucleoside kinase [Saccharicrinis aurantiacus]
MHIAIAGNIGAGKTTLTSFLSDHYGWDAHYEEVDDNPYLADFYEDMKQWSFHLQIQFLNNRFSKVNSIRTSGKTVIQDRTIYEDGYIFAPNLFDLGLMGKRDFDNYSSLFKLMNSLVQAPDLLIYIRASVQKLVDQIKSRGRDYESNIRVDYLKHLNDRYEDWINEYTDGKVLIIDIDELDFINDKEAFKTLTEKIDAQLEDIK